MGIIIPLEPINEGSTARIKFLIVNYDGVPVPAASLTSVKMTLKDDATDTVINNQSETELLGYVDENGNLTFILQPEDNPIVGTPDAGALEAHRILLTITTIGQNPNVINKEELIYIRNMKYIT